jgi:hypothetical protein
MDSMWRKATHLNQKGKVDLLHKEVLKAIKSGAVADRRGLMNFMEDELGLTVTRASDKTVSVKFPGSAKAVRLKGPAYEYQSDYKTLVVQSSATGHSEPTNMGQAKERLAQLLSLKAQHITNTPTTTRKEQVYVQPKPTNSKQSSARRHRPTAQRTATGSEREKRHFERPHQHLGLKGGLERAVFQTSGGQWSDPHGRGHPQNGQGLGDASSQPQQAGHLCQNPSATNRPRGPWAIGQRLPSFNSFAEIDEQIRALSIQLNDCPAGSLEARAISDQLNVLQGAKQSQHGAPSRKRHLKP